MGKKEDSAYKIIKVISLYSIIAALYSSLAPKWPWKKKIIEGIFCGKDQNCQKISRMLETTAQQFGQTQKQFPSATQDLICLLFFFFFFFFLENYLPSVVKDKMTI